MLCATVFLASAKCRNVLHTKSSSYVVFCGQVNDSYTVLLREKKLPLALLEDPEAAARTGRKTARASLTAAQPFAATFGTKQTRKKPKLSAETYGDLIGSASQKETKCVAHFLCIACSCCSAISSLWYFLHAGHS